MLVIVSKGAVYYLISSNIHTSSSNIFSLLKISILSSWKTGRTFIISYLTLSKLTILPDYWLPLPITSPDLVAKKRFFVLCSKAFCYVLTRFSEWFDSKTRGAVSGRRFVSTYTSFVLLNKYMPFIWLLHIQTSPLKQNKIGSTQITWKYAFNSMWTVIYIFSLAILSHVF